MTLHGSFDRIYGSCVEWRALFSEYRALFSEYRALLTEYRALLLG